MKSVSPSPKAMERLRALGEKELLGFIDEVKNKPNKELFGILPNIDGFRKDSKSSIPARKRAMLTHFLKKGDSAANKARADNVYVYFWRAWAAEHLPDVGDLEDLLDGIERAATDGTATLEAAVEMLFRHLHEQSFLNRCSSETLSRLLQFSPFDITESMERLVTGAKPLVAVERDRALSALPDRLKDNEKLLERLQVRLQGDEDLLKQLLERFGKLEEEIVALSSALNRASAPQHEERFETLEKHVAELSHLLEQNTEERQHNADSQAAAVARLHAVERNIADLESLWAEMDDRSKEEAQRFTLELANVSDLLGARAEQIPISATRTQMSVTGSLQVTRIADRPESVRILSEGGDAVDLLARNLASIGLKASGTLSLAQELLAAVVSGRVVFLAGSLAPDVARALARSLAAGQTLRTRVPVGYVDASSMDEDVIRALPADRNTVGVLLLERINNAPIEVLFDALVEIARARDIFVVATLSEGVSSLPDGPLYLQLGPIFDTDVLDWSIFAKAADILAGALTTLDPNSLGITVARGSAHSSELIQLLRSNPSLRTPRVERAAVAYLATLDGLRTQSRPNALQSTVYGWVWPLWRMVDLPWDKRKERFERDIFNGDEPDPRLQLLLALARPAGTQ